MHSGREPTVSGCSARSALLGRPLGGIPPPPRQLEGLDAESTDPICWGGLASQLSACSARGCRLRVLLAVPSLAVPALAERRPCAIQGVPDFTKYPAAHTHTHTFVLSTPAVRPLPFPRRSWPLVANVPSSRCQGESSLNPAPGRGGCAPGTGTRRRPM